MKMSQGRYAAFVCLLLLPLHLAYAAMNVLVADRIDQLRVNLERGRWTLHEAYDQFLVADIAGFFTPALCR